MPSNNRSTSGVMASETSSVEVLTVVVDVQFSVHGGGGGFIFPGVSTSPPITGNDKAQSRQRAEIERLMGEPPKRKW